MRTPNRSFVAARQRRRAPSGLRTDMEQMLNNFAGRKVCYSKCPGNADDSLIDSGALHAFERSGLRWERVSEDDGVAGEWGSSVAAAT